MPSRAATCSIARRTANTPRSSRARNRSRRRARSRPAQLRSAAAGGRRGGVDDGVDVIAEGRHGCVRRADRRPGEPARRLWTRPTSVTSTLTQRAPNTVPAESRSTIVEDFSVRPVPVRVT